MAKSSKGKSVPEEPMQRLTIPRDTALAWLEEMAEDMGAVYENLANESQYAQGVNPSVIGMVMVQMLIERLARLIPDPRLRVHGLSNLLVGIGEGVQLTKPPEQHGGMH